MTTQVTIQKRNIKSWQRMLCTWQDDAGLCTVKQIEETETELTFEVDTPNAAILFYMGNSFGMDIMLSFSQNVRVKVEDHA